MASVFAQKQQLPEIPFNWYKGKTSSLYKEHGIRDHNAIILNAGRRSAFGGGEDKFLVYYRKGNVRKFVQNTEDWSVKEVDVSAQEQTTYIQFLNDCVGKNWLDIDTGKLRFSGNIIVLDGPSDYFTIYQDNKELIFYSNASDSFIDSKVEGWEERQKLLELIAKFNAVF